jgi:ArsR family transcriptional regulator, arsenate/arsenite/antimonite-responsive transcriptional repressor / arsenate reductase (thioredoxin)
MEAPASPLFWPAFLKLLAHELRWKILALLARSDYCGLEIVERLHQPQNLVSYHLRLLATHQLVTERRSAADGRDIYYHLNLDLLGERYAAAALALHPALAISALQASVPPEAFPLHLQHPMRVLFLCTENSARSQMAEGILRHLAGNTLDVCSAGSQPAEVHPYATQVLAEMGIDINQQTAKHLDVFRGQSFDIIITVCDRMKESCPTWPADPEQIHWSLPDPVALEEVSEQERYAVFEEIARQLLTRSRHFLLLVAAEYAQQTRTDEKEWRKYEKPYPGI